MDASQYLRRKTEACTEYISRAKCTSSSERTSMLGFMASATYTNTVRTPLACEIASVGAKNTETVPQHLVTPAACATALCETFLDNRYREPVQIQGCSYPRDPVQPTEALCAGPPCYQGTPEQYREAVRQRVNREEGRECACD